MTETSSASSPDRILTTHAGSLPRPPEVAALLNEVSEGRAPNPAELGKAVAAAVADAVDRQVDAGIDYVSDGEMGTVSFLDVTSRLSGFDGAMTPYYPQDLAAVAAAAAPRMTEYFIQSGDVILPSNTSREISYLPDHVTQAISQFREALASHPGVAGGFLASPSPGILSRLGTSAFDSHEEFVMVLAEAMRGEYRRIASAGLMLQLDSPDLAMGRHTDYYDCSLEEFRDILRTHIRAINHSLEGIPAEQVRLHACWGNYVGPHHFDVPLDVIIDLLYEARVGTLVIEMANPRHRHEWAVFRDHPLPEGMKLAAGVVDTVSVHVEHPQVVADSLIRLAGVVGKERLIAATDCGFATFAGVPEAPAELAYLKLAALAEGARLASAALWA